MRRNRSSKTASLQIVPGLSHGWSTSYSVCYYLLVINWSMTTEGLEIQTSGVRSYLAKEPLESSQLSHGHGHLTHVVCHIPWWTWWSRRAVGQRFSQRLLQCLHSLWQSIFSLLWRLLQVADSHQLLLS